MQPIYFISGLGADERVFRLLNLPGYELHYIVWEQPEKNETLAEYTARLLPQIKSEAPVIIAVSFGGIIAQEMARLIPIKKLVIISSLKNRNELPPLYKFASAIRLNRIIPALFFKRSTWITDIFFGVKGTSEKNLLKNILQSTDTAFLKWAIEQALHWKPDSTPFDITHIHGTNDMILPIKYIRPDYRIEGGGHLMVLNKAREVSAILREVLK